MAEGRSNLDWVVACVVLAAIASFMQFKRSPSSEPVVFDRAELRDAPREETPEQRWADDKRTREKAPPSPHTPISRQKR